MKFELALGKFNLRFGRGEENRPARLRRRSFPGASMSRLTNDFLGPATSADAELQTQLRTLRYRSRQLERENDYVRRYFKLAENNVLGAYGIGLQMKIRERDGTPDKLANEAVENAWWLWGKRKCASLNQRYSWCALERLVLRSALRDGAILVRIIRVSPTDDNPFGYTLQPLEIDHLDHDYNGNLPNGNEVRMGIELTPNGQVVAYHLFNRHPGEWNQTNRKRTPFRADEIIHVNRPERIGQTAGFPSLVSAMLRLKMLGGYEEAELTAAREGACKGGFIQNEMPPDFNGDDKDADGNQLMDMEPGVIRELDPGQSFVEHDPKHPNTAYPDFIKGVLRGLASGLGVSYTSLANDLEGVNYSSIRAGLLEEREEWKGLQNWLIEDFHEQVFESWLEHALIVGAVKLPNGSALSVGKFQKFNSPEWKPRRWPWVDPEKDISANVIAVEKGFSSRRRIIAEQGADIEEIFDEQRMDNELAAKNKLDFSDAPAAKPPGKKGSVDAPASTDE